MKDKDKIFIQRVLAHYKAHGRHDLVWRKSITPYKILVSEIMLQQTQVARVLSKYKFWMKQYPTLEKLGKASLLAILSLWEGLGYQRRAKALFDLSRTVHKLPTSYEDLIKLPGVGPYTASAIVAFAYDRFPPRLLETNIRTALIEHFHLPAQAGFHKDGIDDGDLYEDLARLAGYASVKKLGARHWYYALMDYGALLKSRKVSHNAKSKHYTKQSPYKGSTRELRARALFAITNKKPLPEDARLDTVLDALVREGYIRKRGRSYVIS